MTDYLQLARERAAGAPPADASNPYLAIAQDEQKSQQSRARFVIEQALKGNPELAAERQRLSQTSGLPLAVIERNLEEVRRKEAAAAIDLARMAEESPVLARQLVDPTFTSVAVDDLSTLETVGKFVNDLGGAMKSGVFRASRGAAGTFQAGFELLAPALDFLEPVTAVGGNPLRRLAEGFAMQGAAAGQTAEAAMPRTDSILSSGFYSGIQSLTQNLMTLPLAFAPGGQGAALAGMTAFTGGDAYQQAREKGLPMSQALPFAASQAAIEYATEKLPLAALLKDVKVGAGFMQILGRQIALEVPGEQIATVLQDLNEWAILNPGRPFSAYLEERPSAAAQTLIATIVGTGGNVAVVKGLETMISRAVRDGANMQQAGLAAQALEQAMRGAEASLLRQRSPDQFRSLMSQMSQDGSLYVDAAVLNQMPPEILQRLPGVLQTLPEALLANAPVEVKLADALTVLPGTPEAQVFMQNARTAPDAPTLIEAEEAGKQAQEFLQQEAARVIEQAADQEALRQSQEAVKTNVKQQLAATGRFRDAVNEGYATWAAAFYTAYGSRLGMTPEEFYQRYPLRVLGAPVGQQTGVLNAEAAPVTVRLGERDVPVKLGALDAQRGNVLVPVNAAAFDAAWRAGDTFNSFYIGPGGVGNTIGERYPQFGEFASTAPSIDASVVSVDENGVVGFGDGRHRFAFMRDQGVQTIPVAMDAESLQNAIAAGYVEQGVLEQRAAAPSPRARPMPPQIAAAADIGNARTIAASQQWPTNRDFKLAIQNAVRAVMGQRDLREDTPTNRAYITQQLLKEAREALITNSNAIGWYDEKVTTALEVVSTIHPELKTDEQSKFAFIWALAVTSNGIKVDKNFELAERSYRIWKESDADPAKRKLPTSNIGVGPTASKIHEGLRAYNTLIERWGFDRLRSFATTLQPNRDVQAAFGRKVSGEGMDTQVYGAGILGPKIGNGFFMNLYGEFGQLTMDRWWVRMWGRITGDLVEINPAATREARDSFVALIDLIKADRQALRAVEQAIGAKLNKGTPVETAKAIIKATSKEEVRDALDLILPATPEREAAAKEIRGKLKDFVSIGDELRKAAKSYYGYLDGQIEVPGGSKRRDMMREVSQVVLAELQKDNPSLTMADFQALMWYPEKTLYDSAGAQEQDSEGYDDDEAPDYANAAIKLARDQGVSDANINAAVERARSDIASRQLAGRGGRGSEGVPAQGGDGAGADTGASAGTLQQAVLEQGPRGTFNPQTLELVLNPNADLSTWFHETGHFFLEVLADVARQPNAPAQITDDYNKVLAWFGVTPEQWAGFSLDQKRPYHERWAESIEQYVIEGKAPSVELQPVMRRFRAWLTSVYQSLKAFVTGKPELELNDDIRRVMDRMLATDEQIAQANEVAGFLPDEQADGEAAERLQKRSMADLKWAVKARDKVIAKLKRQAREVEKALREQVTAEVEQRPEVLAKAAIAQAEKQFEKDPVAADMNIAAIADSFGFTSVDAMYRAIELFGNKKDAIDGIVERRMLEENGDLIDERAIQEAANEAVHNEARARSLATELRTQQEMLGGRTDTGRVNTRGAKITVNTLVEAAKQFGANVVARTPLKDLRATAWKHTAAERRAGKRWAEATAKGDTAAAVQAKQDQVLNNAAAKAALEAADQAKKTLEFFARVTKGNDEKIVEKGRDPDIVNAARAVLAAYGVQTPASKTAAAYLEAVQKNDPETYAAIEPMVTAATQNAQPLEALTFEELQGLGESVQAMWHLAKRSRQMEVDGDLMDIDEAADQLFAKMEEIGIPDTVPGETGALTRAELLARQWLQAGPALLRRVEQWAEAKDGTFGGPFLRLIFQPVKDAADRYRTDRLAYRKKFQALVDAIAPTMKPALVEAPELGYTFGRGHNGIGMAELLHAVLHTGNDSNKRKLLLGRGWATENADGTLDTSRWDAFLTRLHDTGVLTKAHWDFAQGVWDLMEETKPLAQKTHRDVFGRYFEEITANPVETPFGTYRGGYVPAQADPLLVQDADLRELLETENAGMSYAFPQTNRGFTKGRVEYNRPLKLDLRTLPQHIDKVLLFSHMEPAVRGAARLLRRPKVSQPLGRIDPTAISGVLRPWLNRAARQTVETPISADAGLNRMASAIRGRVGMALMFANVSNTLQQITGLLSANIKVPAADMMRAAASYIANPKKLKDSVWTLSPYMADRASNEVAVLSDTLDAILINPSTYERAEAFTRQHGYFLQTFFDNQLSPIIWTGAYNQALREGMDERMAIRYADGVIRQTQGSTLPEDVSRIETGPAYARLFTQFIGYFNMVANTNATALQQIAREQGLKKGAGKAFYVLMMGLMLPIWMAEAIALAFRGGPEDEDDDGYLDDWMAAVFGFGTIKGVLAGVPFIGALGQSAIQRFNDNPMDDRLSVSPTISILESAAGAPASVYKAIVDDASAQKAVRDAAALITVTTGLPAMTLARPVGYAAGVAQGRIEPTSAADLARGLITGTASPESKAR